VRDSVFGAAPKPIGHSPFLAAEAVVCAMSSNEAIHAAISTNFFIIVGVKKFCLLIQSKALYLFDKNYILNTVIDKIDEHSTI
jgi:hypothetical protein